MQMKSLNHRRVGKSLPTNSDLNISYTLTNMAIGFKQESDRFVAGKVFPELPVPKHKGSYYVWNKDDLFRDEAEIAAAGTPAPLQDIRLSSDTFNCKVYHLGGLVSEEDMADEDEAVSKEVTHTEAIVTKLLIRRERQWASNYFTTSKWTGSTTGADLVGGTDFVVWSNYTSSDPVQDIEAQCIQMEKLGVDRKDFTLTVGAEVYAKLVHHPKFLERYEFTQAAIMSEALIARVLNIKQVVVPKASYNSAGKFATASMAFIQGKNALLTYSPPSPRKDLPSAGYHFVWSKLIGAANEGIRIRKWWDPDIRSTKVVGESSFDPKLTSSVLGVFFSAAVA